MLTMCLCNWEHHSYTNPARPSCIL
jgi:hypothetical protein